MECTVQIHKDANKKKTWVEHTVDGWYLGTLPNHYRAHIIQVKITQLERVSETIFFKHKSLTNTIMSHTDRLVAAAKALYSTLVKKI